MFNRELSITDKITPCVATDYSLSGSIRSHVDGCAVISHGLAFGGVKLKMIAVSMTHPNISESLPADAVYKSRSSESDALPEDQPATLRRPKAMPLPAALMALFLFSQLFDYHALHLSTVTPDKALFLVLSLLFGYAAMTHRLRAISWSGTEVCMLLFAILCTVSYVVTNPDAGGQHYKWLTTLFNLIWYPFGIYLFAKKTSYTAAKTIWLLWAIVCIGVYLAFTASFEHFGLKALIFPKYIADPHVGIQFGRSRGPMVGSNPMGEWLVLVYLATCMVMPFARTFTKVLLQGLILLTVIGVYFTNTRGGWISLAAVVVLAAIFGGKFGTQSRIITLVVLVAFFAGAGSKFSYGGQTLFSKRQNTVDYRISNDETTFSIGMANFWTGTGYGSFSQNWQKYFTSKEQELTKDLTDGNHNIYLGLFADLGFPGVALYVMLLGFVLRDCIRIRKSLDPRFQFERNLALSSIGLVVILLWEGMSGDLRFNPTLNTVTFLFVGITASMKHTSLIRKRVSKKVKGQTQVLDNTQPGLACASISGPQGSASDVFFG
ncbi:MAG: O-antigen ligase family protein [Candidatus Sulfotelmatobacter sp.]